MRLSAMLPFVALAIAAVLAVAVWGLRGERARLLGAFADAQQDVAVQLVDDLRRELDVLDGDARLIATLTDRAADRAMMNARDERAFILSGFDALATVVRHHRSIALYREGKPEVIALDPSENPEGTAAYRAWSAAAAAHVGSDDPAVIEGPREGPDGRQFFVYARAVSRGGAVVLVSEARFLLQPVLKTRAALVRHFLLDPAGSLWVGCATPATCRAFTASDRRAMPGLDELAAAIGANPEGTSWSAEAVPAALGLPARPAALSWKSLEHGGRRWTAGVTGSTQAIEARERSLLRRLIATSTALVLTLGGIGAVIIAHQRRAAALGERLRHSQEVAHLRERMEKLFDNVSVGLIGVTREGKVALTNRFLRERLPGVEQGASLAEALTDGDAAAAAEVRAVIDETLRTAKPALLSGDDFRLVPSRPGHFDVRIIPLEQPAEDVTALALVEDLSELKSLEKQLVRAEKLGTVGVLTAGLAHEIGTPLGIIRGRAEVLLERVSEPAVARDLELVVRQIDHIGNTIRQVLDFARAQPVELGAIDPSEAITSAVAMLEWRIRQKELFVRMDLPPDVPPIAADADQLQQVLVNLLINACDACYRKGAILIRTQRTPDGRHVQIAIRDDGCGIPPENLNAVFDPFFTTKKRGEGTGLGLPVAASIVRNHHGDIALTSQKGQGTTVTIIWPVGAKEARAHG